MGHVMCPVTLPLVVAGDGGGCLKLRALAGRSLSVFLSLSIQAVAYLPVEYSSRARNGDRYGKEAEMHNELGCVSCSVLPFCFSDRPPKIFLPRRFYPEGTSLLLPPITINSAKLDLGVTAPPHDGNHSTCGYLGVIWTP